MPQNFCLLDDRGIGVTSTEPPSDEAVISAAVGAGGVNRRDDVLTVQMLLNEACLSVGAPSQLLDVDGWIGPKTIGAIREFQQDQLGFSDGRVDPGQKTITRLNAINAGNFVPTIRGNALGITSAPAPATTPATPKQKALEAVPTATFWANGALLQVSGLLASFVAANGAIFIPSLFDMVNTHFHLDRDPSQMLLNLQKLVRVYTRITTVLGQASTIFQDAPAVSNSPFADAPMGGFNLPNTPNFVINFRPGYVNCGPNCRAAMLVHEGAHFVGGINEITHFAMEFPAPNGAPQGAGHTRNYKDMLTSEAMNNASSYAAFAIQAATGIDSRFGAADITK